MTREEAIRILPDMKGAGNEWDMALDMAIKALEAQDVDAISRQAVMWMLTNLSYTQCKTQGEADVIDTAKTMVIAMPSAQPDPCDVCAHKNDCGDMRIYCPAERRTDEPDKQTD